MVVTCKFHLGRDLEGHWNQVRPHIVRGFLSERNCERLRRLLSSRSIRWRSSCSTNAISNALCAITSNTSAQFEPPKINHLWSPTRVMCLRLTVELCPIDSSLEPSVLFIAKTIRSSARMEF
jgi:hypothetical protein